MKVMWIDDISQRKSRHITKPLQYYKNGMKKNIIKSTLYELGEPGVFSAKFFREGFRHRYKLSELLRLKNDKDHKLPLTWIIIA